MNSVIILTDGSNIETWDKLTELCEHYNLSHNYLKGKTFPFTYRKVRFEKKHFPFEWRGYTFDRLNVKKGTIDLSKKTKRKV